LRVEDVVPHGHAVDRATVRQKKTGQPVRFEMTEQTREALDNYIEAANNTDLLKFLDASVVFYLGHGSIAGTSYGADEAGAQATAQSERTKPVLVANRFHAISQASMMSAKLRNTELASQWLRR
jgi:hypothetical protein